MKPKLATPFKETAPPTMTNGEQLTQEEEKKFQKTILMGNLNLSLGFSDKRKSKQRASSLFTCCSERFLLAALLFQLERFARSSI
ncbi:AUGMIN subunit [Trichinella pseudospiralis]